MGSHSRSSLLVHVVFATRFRLHVLVPEGDAEVASAIDHFARELEAVTFAIGCASDHVHVLAQLPPSVAPARFIGRIKACSSRAIRRDTVA